MAVDYTVDGLVTKVRRAGKLPAHDPAGTDAALLAKLCDEQRLFLARLLLSVREQHRQAYLDINTTAGTYTYALPARAVAAGIKQVRKVSADGTNDPLYTFDDARLHMQAQTPGDYYIEGNLLTFFADPGAGTIRVVYERRMSELVLSTSARAITAINTGTKTVTISAAPSTFTGRTTMDIVKATPHFDLYSMEAYCTAIGSSATTITFLNTLPTDLAVGDYICVPGESPVCMAPWELHDVLAHRAAYVWLVERGDAKAGALAKLLHGEDGQDGPGSMVGDALSILAPRVKSANKPLLNLNAPGWWRGRWFWRWPT